MDKNYTSLDLANQFLQSAQFIMFDWDGTMVNSTDFVPQIHARILKEMGIPCEEWIIAEKLGISQTDLIKLALNSNSKPLVAEDELSTIVHDFAAREDAILDEYYADKRIALRPGLIDLLKAAQEKSIPMAIVSNAFDVVTHKRLSDTSLIDKFFSVSHVFGRSRVGTTKPDPTQILEACRHSGVIPSNSLFWGDTESDFLACQRAGVGMIQIGSHAVLSAQPLAKLNDFTGLEIRR
jgi:HAD superfamily hydrolase (TIGR01549 family)